MRRRAAAGVHEPDVSARLFLLRSFMLGRAFWRVGTRRAAIPPRRPPAGPQNAQGHPGVPAIGHRRAPRTCAPARSGDPGAVRYRRAGATRGGQDGRPARRAVRPAGPPRAGAAAAGLLDLSGPARGVPRHRARFRHAHRGRDRGHRSRGGHRARRLVGAAPGPAARRPGTRHLPGQRGHLVPRLAGGPGRRPGRLLPGAVRIRARGRHHRLLPRRPPGAAARRGRQPRRSDRPPGRTRLA